MRSRGAVVALAALAAALAAAVDLLSPDPFLLRAWRGEWGGDGTPPVRRVMRDVLEGRRPQR